MPTVTVECQYSGFVDCTQGQIYAHCPDCGWNPAVARERIERARDARREYETQLTGQAVRWVPDLHRKEAKE